VRKWLVVLVCVSVISLAIYAYRLHQRVEVLEKQQSVQVEIDKLLVQFVDKEINHAESVSATNERANGANAVRPRQWGGAH
jgi:hypothetical protein